MAAVIDESTLEGIDGAAIADAALIAWVGEPEPMTKITLQQALTSALAGDTVHILPGNYQFATVLTVPRAVTLTAATTTQIFGRVSVEGAGLATDGIVLSPSANQQSVVTVTAPSGAAINDLQIANPDSRTGANLIGINLASSAGSQVTDVHIGGMSTGIAVAATNAAAGPAITGATITFLAKGIGLGGTSGASVSSSVLTGPGAAGTMGIDYGTSAAAEISDVTISGVLAGISTGSLTSTAAGPRISGVSITATGNAINLAATAGARVTDVDLLCEVPTNNAAAVAINVNTAHDVVIADATASGFATGVGVANTSTATDIVISGGDLAAVTNAIALGAATSPTVTGVTVRGQLRAGVIATTGVNVFNATGVTITDLNSMSPRKGISVAASNTSAGLSIVRGTFTVPEGGATSAIELGGATEPSVDSPVITGTGRATSKVGITTGRATGAVITDATITGVGAGITGTWVRLGGTPLEGHVITGANIDDTNVGIYTANTDGTVVDDSTIDAHGEGVAGHEDANFTLTNATITGHPGPGLPSSGTNAVRFYYTDGITVTDVTTTGGATGLYLDMSYDATVTRLEVSEASWYGTYAESITGYTLRDSYLHDNGGIGNLTINPSSADAIDLRQVSSDVLFEDNLFVDNLAGLYVPLGAFDITFRGNTVIGTNTYVLYLAPAHDVTVEDNDITYTHDADSLDDALELGQLPPLGDPPGEPPIEGPPPPDIESAAFASVAFDVFAAAEAEEPPPTPAAAIWVSPAWFNLDTASASSDGVRVLGNRFVGDGAFIGVGTVSNLDIGSANAPTDPATMRALRDTVEVSRNVFPQNSTAIVTVDDAEEGTDETVSTNFINGDAAVDARRDNDWGSPCYARVPTDGYDGGGAWVHEVRATQVLYPQGCEGGGDDDGTDGDGSDPLADTGMSVAPPLLTSIALISAGVAVLAAATRRNGARER